MREWPPHLDLRLESIDDAVITVASDGRIAGWNRVAGRMYGYAAADAMGQDAALLLPRHEREALTSSLTGNLDVDKSGGTMSANWLLLNQAPA